MPAADWLAVLMSDSLDVEAVLLTHSEPEDRNTIYEALFDETLTDKQLTDICLDIISLVCGRPWWVAMRLIATAKASWPVLGGGMLQRGIDAERLSISGWLDVLLLTTLEAMKPDAVTMFSLKLEQPPPGIEVPAESMEMSADAFMAMA